MSPALILWMMFLLLGPFYVFGNGLPQPRDGMIIFVVPLAISEWDGAMERRQASILRSLFWFTLWIAFVNYGWATILWKWSRLIDFVIHPFFYIFNGLVFFSALLLARRWKERFLRLTFDVVLITIVAQVLASFVYKTTRYRGILFFNQPNQLGYYALLSACLFAMMQRPLNISRLKASIGVTCCAYLAVLSASRAALAGIVVLLAILLFASPKTIIIGSLAAIGLTSLGGPITHAINAAGHRATHQRDPNGSFAIERGYDRIWKYPEYLPLGAGEGDYGRFAEIGENPREIHSSLGTVFFSYGIVGVFLFLAFLLRVFKGAGLRLSLMLIPPLMFTVAHQGLRSSMLWVVLAVFVVLKRAGPANAVQFEPGSLQRPATT